jgi:hypothetical protein
MVMVVLFEGLGKMDDLCVCADPFVSAMCK